MPSNTPELLTAVDILEQDSVVDPTNVGGRVQTNGVSSNSSVSLTGFTGTSSVGRGPGGVLGRQDPCGQTPAGARVEKPAQGVSQTSAWQLRPSDPGVFYLSSFP